MKLFKIANDGSLIHFKEQRFDINHHEAQLEELLENNPQYFWGDHQVFIIGRQVKTNLNTIVDLLGIDKSGNTVVIELKRGKTPRETIAQLLEYASYVGNLDYDQLNDIYRHYIDEASSLIDAHAQYFNDLEDEKVSFNKSTKLVIVGQNVSREIRQTALFLRRQGIDINCLEFKYHESTSGEKIISSDFIVGDEEYIRRNLQTSSEKKTDIKEFQKHLDTSGSKVFQNIFDFAKKYALKIIWGRTGFSMNVEINSANISLLWGFPKDSTRKQSIYTSFWRIKNKVYNGESIVEFYRKELNLLDNFKYANSELKWLIEGEYINEDVDKFQEIVKAVIAKIQKNGLK